MHLLVIALAVRSTAWTAPTREPLRAEPVVFVAPVRNAAPPAPPTAMPRAVHAPTTALRTLVAPPVIGQIDVIPTRIPLAGAIRDLVRDDVFGPTGGTIVGDIDESNSPAVADGQPLTERLVDRAVVAVPGTTRPRYPSALQGAGVEGDVRAQFVVDTLGRVEQGSVRILESTHELFSQAVRDALARARFIPAEARGRRVRQLVEQAFKFRSYQR